MRAIINKARICSNYLIKMKIIQSFSTFKTKFQVLKLNQHSSIIDIYNHMTKFENDLQYLEKLKYKKAVEDLRRKITKIYKKQQANLNPTSQSQPQSKQTPIQHILKLPFNTSISHQLFYEIQNQQYKPIDQSQNLNKISLDQLYKIVVGDGSMFCRDLELVTQMILSNPNVNEELYRLIGERCGYFQDQFAMAVYQDYAEVLKEADMAEAMGKSNSLRKLKGIKNSQSIYTKDFKFLLKKISPQQNYKASQIAKILTKYGFSSQKVRTFALKSLSNEGYKSLSPQSLKNHFFVLGYHKTSITELNDNMFKLFDIACDLSDKQQSLQFMGQMGPLNSLLFYLLCNKIEVFEIVRSIVKKLVEKQIQYNLSHKDKENNIKNLSEVHIIDREIFCIMLKLIKTKFQINPEEFRKQLGWKKEYTCFLNPEQILKNIIPVNTNSNEDFERYLHKKRYKYEKIIFSPSQQSLFQIEDRSFICLNLSRINIKTQKTNGIGQLILQSFKHKGQKIKNINPVQVLKCQRWTQKQQYFKSKLKGLKEPESTRERRFDF